jgi:hypothetical protein
MSALGFTPPKELLATNDVGRWIKWLNLSSKEANDLRPPKERVELFSKSISEKRYETVEQRVRKILKSKDLSVQHFEEQLKSIADEFNTVCTIPLHHSLNIWRYALNPDSADGVVFDDFEISEDEFYRRSAAMMNVYRIAEQAAREEGDIRLSVLFRDVYDTVAMKKGYLSERGMIFSDKYGITYNKDTSDMTPEEWAMTESQFEAHVKAAKKAPVAEDRPRKTYPKKRRKQRSTLDFGRTDRAGFMLGGNRDLKIKFLSDDILILPTPEGGKAASDHNAVMVKLMVQVRPRVFGGMKLDSVLAYLRSVHVSHKQKTSDKIFGGMSKVFKGLGNIGVTPPEIVGATRLMDYVSITDKPKEIGTFKSVVHCVECRGQEIPFAIVVAVRGPEAPKLEAEITVD